MKIHLIYCEILYKYQWQVKGAGVFVDVDHRLPADLEK